MKQKIKDLLCGTVTSSPQPRQVFPSDARWDRSVIERLSLDAIQPTAEVQSGIHSVAIGEFPGKQINYDFLLTARPGTALLCHSYGVMPQDGEVGEYIASTFSRQMPATKMW